MHFDKSVDRVLLGASSILFDIFAFNFCSLISLRDVNMFRVIDE